MNCKNLLAFAATIFSVIFSFSQTIPSPKEHFGFNIGDDYQLANYTQTEAYFKKLAAVSDRVKLVDIGMTEEGRHQYMVIVSSPQNLRNLNRYKEISQKLARAENLTDDQAHTLADEGKPVVWIDGGLHATEVVGTQQLIEIIWQTVSRQDPETIRILDQCIILFTHANPDGHELVSDWYMRESDTKKRRTNVPRLYQKYIGHDNNRDFFMLNMKESINMSRQQYIEWMPQIIYNHHQSGPPGSVVAGPPYRDPFNYAFDPLLVTSIDAVGAAMNNRLNREGKPGYTQRAGSVYSTWWNGGLRTTGYFHNMIGLLTEIIGNPTPSSIPLVPARLIPNGATPNPVTPQEWHFRQSIDYSVSLNYAVLNYAVNQRHDLLYGIYRMGKNSIEKGNRDNWSLSPKLVDSIYNLNERDQKNDRSESAGANSADRRTPSLKYYQSVFRNPLLRDARGYIVPADQPDFGTAVRFINALIKSGILIHKAESDFTVEGKKYPAGSYIVKTNQAFRPHITDMFEPQDHPNDFRYPGGPPVPPYDAAGYTLAYEMGVQFDRILNSFDGPFQRLPYGELQSPKGKVNYSGSPSGYILNSAANNSYIAINDLLKRGINVYRVPLEPGGGNRRGSFYVPSGDKVKPIINSLASDLSLTVTAVTKRPPGLISVSPLRIGLFDVYGGSISSGWVRWMMEQYHFPFEIIYTKDVNTTDLRKNYDVILFVSGTIPSVGRAATSRITTPGPDEIPAEFRDRLGRITADTSIPQLKRFMQAGGVIVTIGSSSSLAYHLGLPVRNALVEMINGEEKELAGEKFYIPGSIMRATFDTTLMATWGMPSFADVYFDESPVFNITPSALANKEIKPIAWYASAKTLRSGWAWGQAYLKDGVAAFEATVGQGKLFVFGPEITFRAQTHGTFKLLFNELYRYSPAPK